MGGGWPASATTAPCGVWDAESHADVSQLTLAAGVAALSWGPGGISLGTSTGLVQLSVIARDGHAPAY